MPVYSGMIPFNMKINQIRSFTIIEILVASIVVSIILLGVITTSISLSNSARFSSGNYFVTQSTQSTLNHILKNAALAIGTPSNPGFVGMNTLWDKDDLGNPIKAPDGTVLEGNPPLSDLVGSGKPSTFCIHQNLSLNGSYNILNSNAYHRWLCYTLDTATKNIYWCARAYDVNNPPGTAGYLSSQPANINHTGGAPCSTTDNLLGTATNISTSLSINAAGSSQKVEFQVTIDNCLDPNGNVFGQCVAGGSNNPYVQKTGTISPSGHVGG